VDMWCEDAILYKVLIGRPYKPSQDKAKMKHKNRGASRPKRPSISGRFSKEVKDYRSEHRATTPRQKIISVGLREHASTTAIDSDSKNDLRRISKHHRLFTH
ncbi:hypothetical protein EC957_000295, partial [Mortierella hygrophila]